MTATEPTRANVPTVRAICPKGPFLNLASPKVRAGHCYRRVEGVWVCVNCKQPRP